MMLSEIKSKKPFTRTVEILIFTEKVYRQRWTIFGADKNVKETSVEEDVFAMTPSLSGSCLILTNEAFVLKSYFLKHKMLKF